MNGLVLDTGRAVAFLSRLPVPDRFFSDDSVLIAPAARAYGFAGIVVSLPAALVLLVLLAIGVDPLFAAGLALSCQLLVTGGLHEDGLADCADGFGGSADRERSLAIMKDSTIGAYGGIALILSLLLRVAGVAVVAANATPLAAAICFLGIGAVSRTAMVWHWSTLPAAKSDGVAASAGQPGDDAMQFAMASGGLVSLLLLLPSAGLGGAVLVLVLVALSSLAFSRYTDGRINGHTGDTIGASQQICEVAALLGLALWL